MGEVQRRIYEAFQVGDRRAPLGQKSKMGMRKILRGGMELPGLYAETPTVGTEHLRKRTHADN